MMSRPQITERPAYGPSRAGNHTKTLRGPVGKERPRDRAVISESAMRSTAWFGEAAWLCRTVGSLPYLQQFLSRADD